MGDFERFQNDALAAAASDKKIDEKEYNSLVEEIKASHDDRFKKLFTGADQEVDNARVVDYLVKLFAAKKLSLTAADIWQPAGTANTSAKFNLNMYIENSASMDGYVKGVTEFETAIYNLLGDFKISNLCDSINLNYINSKVTYTKTNAQSPDIQDFIEKLEPATFKQKGGDRGVSDIKSILKSVTATVDDKNVAILASDFVFSPGSNKNAEEYLNNQTVGIKIDFAEKLKKYDLSVVVIQLQSNFDGSYYDKNDKPIPLNAKRPYYIWIFGSSAQIKSILATKMLDNIKGGYQHRIIFNSLKEPEPVDYRILYRPRIGDFELAHGVKGEITGAKISQDAQTRGLFGFSLAVNFSGGMQDAQYFMDPANYRLSDGNYTLTVETVPESDQSLKGYTHILKLQTKELQDESLKIEVIGKTPAWIEESSSVDDTGIATNDKEKQKTFGLKYLIEGVNDAFYPQASTNILNTINISIKK